MKVIFCAKPAVTSRSLNRILLKSISSQMYLLLWYMFPIEACIGVVIFKSQVKYYLFEGDQNHKAAMQDEDNHFQQQIDHSFPAKICSLNHDLQSADDLVISKK